VTTSIYGDSTLHEAENSGNITVSNITSTSLTLNWTSSTDDYTWNENLSYMVIQSTQDNIDTVTDMETSGNGRTLIQNWAYDIDTLNVTGLDSSSVYYYNLIVRDEALNKTAYATTAATTLADLSEPVPGNAETITPASVTSTSLTLNWTLGTDNCHTPGKPGIPGVLFHKQQYR